MTEILGNVEFETRTIGPLVLTTPVLRQLGLAEIVDRQCPVAEQADMGHGVVAELVVQCRLTEPRALYDMPDWADRYGLVALYAALEKADQLNDDRIGRMLDAVYDRRAVIWGELMGRAARAYEIDMRRLHADTAPIKFAGLFADQAEDEGVPRLEPGYNPQGEWVPQLKLFALAAGDGRLPVWFDALSGGEEDSPNYVPQFEAFCEHAQLASMLPLEQVIVLGDRKMPTAENQLSWLRLGVGYIGPTTMQDHHGQTLRELLATGQRWTELPYVAQRDAKKHKKRPARRHFEIQVIEHADRPEAPLELLYTVDHEQAAQDAELDGIYLLVAGGPAANLDDASLLQEWKGQYKVEHCFRLTNQVFLVGPIFLKKPHRIVSLILLIMVGCLVAGLIERQVRRVLAERQEPIHGLMPEGRDHLRPTVPRILRAFAHYSIVHIRNTDGSLIERQFAKLDAVQQQILDVLGTPSPTELFG